MDNTLNNELFGDVDFQFDDASNLVDFSTLPPFDFDTSTLSGQSMPETPMAPCANMAAPSGETTFEPHQFNPQATPFESIDQPSVNNARVVE